MSTRHYRKEVLKKLRRVGQSVLSGCDRAKVLVHAKQWVQEGPRLSNEQKYLIPVLLFSHLCVSHFGIVCLECVMGLRATKSVKRPRFFVRTLFFFFARASRSVRHTEGRRALEWSKKGRELLHSSNHECGDFIIALPKCTRLFIVHVVFWRISIF